MRKIAEFQFGTDVLEIRYRFVISTVAPRFEKVAVGGCTQFFFNKHVFKKSSTLL